MRTQLELNRPSLLHRLRSAAVAGFLAIAAAACGHVQPHLTLPTLEVGDPAFAATITGYTEAPVVATPFNCTNCRTALVGAAPPKHEVAPQDPTLAGQVLIASQGIGDPRFYRTVILMVRHNKDGAFGITINRPIGERSLASLLEMLGEKDAQAEGNVQIFAGGPVQPGSAFVVHTADYNRSETIAANGRVAVTSSREVFRDIGRKKGPQKVLVAFGYAGWAPGQLEAELARNDWFIAPADPKLIFDESRDRVWEEAMARRPRDL
jgi:putative transcriptional regulator